MSDRRQARRARGTALRFLRAVPDVSVAIALLFACALATPRAPLVFHTHGGGEHAHVHADGALEALLGTAEHPPHAAEHASDPRPAYAADHGDAAGHVHHQSRYHAAVVAAAPFVAVFAPLSPHSAPVIGSAPTRAAVTASARAPPLSPAA